MNQLLPCPSCNRHRRGCEAVCPFCGAELPSCQPGQAATAAGRVSRATLIAAGAVLLAGAACDNNTLLPYGTPPPPPPRDAGSDATGAAKPKGTGDANADDGSGHRDIPDGGEDAGR
jgi:hypothetical protein